MPADYNNVTSATPSDSPSGDSSTSSALSGAASGAVVGTEILPGWGTAIGAVIGGAIGYFSAPKKPTYTPIDVNKLITNARSEYATNYQNSIGLEAQYNPTQAAARTSSNQALQASADQTSAGFKARNSMLDDVTSGKSAALYNESSDSILQQLRLGGKLDPETQAAVTRAALQTGASSGLSGSVAQRGLVARDLGLTSMSLLQSRQTAAEQAAQAGVSRLQVGNAAAGLDASTAASLGSIFNGRALPTSGLDPNVSTALALSNVKGQNDTAAALLAQTNKARAQNVQSVLDLGSSANSAGLFGGGGGGGGGDDDIEQVPVARFN